MKNIPYWLTDPPAGGGQPIIWEAATGKAQSSRDTWKHALTSYWFHGFQPWSLGPWVFTEMPQWLWRKRELKTWICKYQGTSVALLQVCCYSLDAWKIRGRNKYCRLSIPEPPWTGSGGEKGESDWEERRPGNKNIMQQVRSLCLHLYSCPTNRFIGTTDSTYMH